MEDDDWPWLSGPKEAWSPKAWYWLHTDAIAYPQTPTPGMVRKTRARIRRFIAELPCRVCRVHGTEYLKKYPPLLGSNREYQIWVWRFHNEVNARLKKPLLTFSEYTRLYSDEIAWASIL